MNIITFNDLMNNVLLYIHDYKSILMIQKSYEFAQEKHKNQKRKSGEPYITHPLNVAYILSILHADADTICAGLLHDIIEDTDVTLETIASEFNPEVAKLVDGVTKISRINFIDKEQQNMANTRKIITSLEQDVRIVIIKLADRLHNMRTLEYQKPEKQVENAVETLEIFVPLANYIGTYRIKSELEDLSLSYINPSEYKEIKEQMDEIKFENRVMMKEMSDNISSKLNSYGIPNNIKIRQKNIYGVYSDLIDNKKIYEIHDLSTLKIMVDTISHCYNTLGIVHELYNPLNEKFKDYIFNPKTNMYRSIHTTVFSDDDRLVQAQIRTFDMDKVASFGLSAYWDINQENSRNIMQEKLKEELQFYDSLTQIDDMFSDNKEFVSQVKNELFSKKIYVHNSKDGSRIELPIGSSVIDYAYKESEEKGNTMIGAIVNDKPVDFYYQLKNKDRVKIINSEDSPGPQQDWLNNVHTTRAKRKILEYLNK